MDKLLPKDKFQDRLLDIVQKCGSAEKLAAKAIGVSSRVIGKYLNGDSLPGMENLVAIAAAGDVSVEWLATGQGPKEREKLLSYNADEMSKFDMVPMAQAKLNAGAGAVVMSEEFRESYAFRKDWINRIATSKNNIFLMQVEGDSMEPLIYDGDTVMVDAGRKDIHTGRIYALGVADSIMIKRLELLPDGRIRIISVNPAYSPYIIGETGPAPRILGHVIWFARQLAREDMLA